MESLVFATGNINKGYEIEERFKKEEIPVLIVKIDFKEPEVNDIKMVSMSKAKEAYEALGVPCFVIDSGFNIFNYPNNPGYPGAFVRRSGIATNVDTLLEVMRDVKDRRCEFMDCLTFYDGKDFYFFYGIDEGTLSYEKRGKYQLTAQLLHGGGQVFRIQAGGLDGRPALRIPELHAL